MKTDAELKSDVSEELAWDPAINATHVGVAGGRPLLQTDHGTERVGQVGLQHDAG